MTHTLDEAGARECLAAEYEADAARENARGCVNAARNQRAKAQNIRAGKSESHVVAAMLAFAASQAGTKAVGEDVVERVARALFGAAAHVPESDLVYNQFDQSRDTWDFMARAAIAARSSSPDTAL